MSKLLIINTSANTGSTGRIAEEIGQTAIIKGYDSYFAYGRTATQSKSHLIQIGNNTDVKLHGIESLLFDNQGFGSRSATKKFIETIRCINPDIINIHNLHGYYINVEELFNYLKETKIPVVWTLHDCWSFTGHCSHYMRFNCNKWMTGCYDCPNSKGYPKSLFWDRSKRNYEKKKELFTSLDNVTIVCPCNWLAGDVKFSYLSKYDIRTIYNGTDITIFQPQESKLLRNTLGLRIKDKVVLGVASVWTKYKGLYDFYELNKTLGCDYKIILVGLNDKQIAALPDGIIGIKRTESVQQLAELYSLADVFVNPTYVDNFPTTNIEALACGTPVVTYNTGGSPEAVDEYTGVVVEQGNVSLLRAAVESCANNKKEFTKACRERALKNFNKLERFKDYVRIFDRLIKR